jgi:hypothetical protein
MSPIISIFDKTLDTNIQNIAINTSTLDNALSDIKKNFFRLNHNINFAKKYLLEHKQDIADNIGGIGEELGTLAAYQLGLLSPSGDSIKTFKFNFSNKSDINLSFSIPSFNIYDTPPGLDIIDYVPKFDSGCDYLDGDIIIFPGVPCALPEIAMCKKTLTKKILGKRINLGTIIYPCGYKQKTIGSIVLNKNESSPDILFSFPGFDFKCVGSINISGEITIEMTSGLPIDLFSKIFKGFDSATYNSITNFGKNPITDIATTLKSISVKNPSFQWFLKFAKYAITQTSPGISILNICITSIKISSTTSINYLSANYGSETLFNINNLSYSENNYELLKNGRYISISIDTTANIDFNIGLGSYQIGQLAKDAEASSNLLGLIIKMITSEKNTSQTGIRFRELEVCLNFINKLLDSENESITPFKIPSFITMLKNVKTKVDLSLNLSISIIEPVPVVAFNASVIFTFAQIIEFIKQYLAEFVVDTLLSSADIQMFLINIESQAIEQLIKPAKLPDSITSQIHVLNKKFDYARNLFKGYITIGIMESTSFLQQFIPNKNTNYTYNIEFPLG